MKHLKFLIIVISIVIMTAFGLSDGTPTIFDFPIEPSKALYRYDSVNNRIKYFIDNSRFCQEESLDVVLPRFEFDTTRFGLAMERIVDSVQINNCFISAYLEYDDMQKCIVTSPVGCAANSRGLVLCTSSRKPLFIDNSINDSLLQVYHLREMKDSFVVKLGYILGLDRAGYRVIFLNDKERDIEGFLVLYEHLSVDSVPLPEVREKWSWIHNLR